MCLMSELELHNMHLWIYTGVFWVYQEHLGKRLNQRFSLLPNSPTNT